LPFASACNGADKRRSEAAPSLQFDNDRLIINCEDNGCGIAPELLQQVFEPFFTTKRNQGGTGLGLHIAFNLTTQKLGGTIEVASTLGKGTSFRVTLPLAVPG
jgi:two-component system NtrC family sensor kinase